MALERIKKGNPFKFYLATSRQHKEFANSVIEELERGGAECIFNWTKEAVWEKGIETPGPMSELMLVAIKSVDYFILLLPAGLMSHVELGLARAFNRKIIIIENFNLTMQREPGEEVFSPLDKRSANLFYFNVWEDNMIHQTFCGFRPDEVYDEGKKRLYVGELAELIWLMTSE